VSRRDITIHEELDQEELELVRPVGFGTAGSVYSGYYKGTPVAIKKIRNDIDYEDFLKEISILSVVYHKNLIRCVGGVTKDSKRYIVTELMHTNLNEILQLKVAMDLGMRLKIALDTASGVDFLHQHCNMIHRDLKSLNILIFSHDSGIDVKICDFGISRVIDTKRIMTGNVGTVSWIAPEVFEHKKYNEKADVYSFGIILWELITEDTPFANLTQFTIPIAVIKGERPRIPHFCNKEVKKIN